MKWSTSSFAVLIFSNSVLAIIDPIAPATPCVSPRAVDDAVQSGIALGCQNDLDIPTAVCSDYLAQEILAAISYFCGNQTEAFNYCNSLPDVSAADCQYSDPTGGGIGPDCTQETLDAYNICGNTTGSDLFANGDPIALSQCLYFDLGLCTPEDGDGHFNTVFLGSMTDCPIPAYTPACGVFSTSSPATTTAPPASSSPPSSVSFATPSSQTTEPGSPSAITITSSPTGAPTASTASTAPPARSPSASSPFFHLTINTINTVNTVNTTFTTFIDAHGNTTTDPTQAQTFHLLNAQLQTTSGLLVQADHGTSPDAPVPYTLFAASEGALPYSTNFSLVPAGVDPVGRATADGQKKKRQLLGQTALRWINAAFSAPGPAAEFCVFESAVYAVLQSAGLGAEFYAACAPVALDALYVDIPGPVSGSSGLGSATVLVQPTTTTVAAVVSTVVATATTLQSISCPVGQTVFRYTTVVYS